MSGSPLTLTVPADADGGQLTLTAAPVLHTAIDAVLTGLDSPHSRRAYTRALVEFSNWWLDGGHRNSTQGGRIDYAVVAQWRRELVDAGKLAPQSINQRLAAVRALVRELALRGWITHEAAAAITAIKSVRAQGVRTGVWLSRVEVEKLLSLPVKTIAAVRNQALLRMLLGCGLRRSDAAGLMGSDIAQVNGRWALVNIVGKGRRVGSIPIPGWAYDGVRRWWEVRRALLVAVGRVGAPDDADLPVFTRVKADTENEWCWTERIGVQVISDIVAAAGSAIGRPELRAHDLRRTFAQQAAQDAADIHQLQLSLRHANLATTSQYLGNRQDFNRAPCDALKWEVQTVETGKLLEMLREGEGNAGKGDGDV